MDIKEQFNLIAQEYDCNRKKFIPCFEDYYVNTTAFLSSNIKQPKKILDLGAGTGLLSYYWYQHFPKSEFLLVDISEDMLSVAKKRFSGIDTVKYDVRIRKATPFGVAFFINAQFGLIVPQPQVPT